jgi:predicted aminopeptidase
VGHRWANLRRLREFALIKPMHRILFLTLLLGQTACSSASYLWHVSAGQIDILLSRRALTDARQDTALTDEERRKLALVPIAKKFGNDILGLKGEKTYRSYVKLDRPYATLVLTACPPDSLDVHKWRFPIVGAMPYKGFFNETRANLEKETLRDKGYDVYLRPASAFSTLGWFEDPILSPMLRMDDRDLVNTVLHEMAHVTIYFPNHTNFNEAVATFIGNLGAVAFLSATDGQESNAVSKAVHEMEDQERFANFIRGTLDGLRLIYDGPASREEKLIAKDRYIAEAKERFRLSTSDFHNPLRYARFPDQDWNNASLLARNAYFGDLLHFAKLFSKRGESLREFIAYLSTWKDADPRARLLREAGEGDIAFVGGEVSPELR